MTKKKRKNPGRSAEELAEIRQRLAEKRKALELLPVEFQVVDMNHAKSPEVMDYCVRHLSSGGTWAELRKKLGLGPSYADRRWRYIRQAILEVAIPLDEQEALQAKYATNQYLLSKLDKFMEEIEDRIVMREGEDNEHHFVKLKLESLKMMFERNEIDFDHYIEMRRLKTAESKSQGVSIIFKNVVQIPRPGENLTEVDVTPKKNKIRGSCE